MPNTVECFDGFQMNCRGGLVYVAGIKIVRLDEYLIRQISLKDFKRVREIIR